MSISNEQFSHWIQQVAEMNELLEQESATECPVEVFQWVLEGRDSALTLAALLEEETHLTTLQQQQVLQCARQCPLFKTV